MRPASTKPATSSKSAPCWATSAVSNIERVNMNSQCSDTLLRLSWEFMFTRAVFETPDMIAQHRLLNDVSALVDDGVIRTTLGEEIGTINAANLRRAHAIIESGKARGKLVLTGF